MKSVLLVVNLAISIVLAVLCGIYFTYITGYILQNLILQIVIYVVLLIVCLYLSFVLHEVGHVLFGAITKMGVKFNKLSLFSPLASCSVNPQTDKGLKWRFIITVLGGLLVNLLLLLIGTLSYEFTALIWLCPFMPTSFYVLFLNLLPFEYETGKTDGLVVEEVLKSADSAKVLLNILTVQGQLNCGKQLKDINKDLLFKVPQLQEDDKNFIILTQLRAEYYQSIGDSENYEKQQKRFEQLQQYL